MNNDLMKKSMAEETIRQKEVARQMALQMLKNKQQSVGDVSKVLGRDATDLKNRSHNLDHMLSDRQDSKSMFSMFLKKNNMVLDTVMDDIRSQKGKQATELMFTKMSMDDAIPALSEHPDILDASKEIALALTQNDHHVEKYYDKIRDKVEQYKAEKSITESDADQSSQDDFGFGNPDDSKMDHGFLDDDQPYDLQSFMDFKDDFLKRIHSRNGADEHEADNSLNDHMAKFVQDHMENNPMLGSGLGADAPDTSSGTQKYERRGFYGGNDGVDGADLSDQGGEIEFLRKLLPRGMAGAIALAFFMAQQACTDNMKGPATDVFSTSGTVSKLAQFSNNIHKMWSTTDDGAPIKCYELNDKGEVIFYTDGPNKGQPKEIANPTEDDYIRNINSPSRGKWFNKDGNTAKEGETGATMIPKTEKAAQSMVDFLRDSAKIFSANLDNLLPSKAPIPYGDKVEDMCKAYAQLMGTDTNDASRNEDTSKTGKAHEPLPKGTGIIEQWVMKNDPKNAQQVLGLLNSKANYMFADKKEGPETVFATYNTAKDGFAANLATSTAALNLGQSQLNAINTGCFGWMKSLYDNLQENVRKVA